MGSSSKENYLDFYSECLYLLSIKYNCADYWPEVWSDALGNLWSQVGWEEKEGKELKLVDEVSITAKWY